MASISLSNISPLINSLLVSIENLLSKQFETENVFREILSVNYNETDPDRTKVYWFICSVAHALSDSMKVNKALLGILRRNFQ